MSDLQFECPHCNQQLEVPNEMLGEKIECPSCNGHIQLPDPQPIQTPPPQRSPRKKRIVTRRTVTRSTHRACPYCGEEILRSAKKCKHCGEFVRGKHEVETNVKQGALIGSVACFIIGIVVMSITLWSFIIYSPLFLAAFVLSIVAMSQKRVAGGLIMLLLTLIVPPALFFGLGASRGQKAMEEVSDAFTEARDEALRSRGVEVPKATPQEAASKPVDWTLQTNISPIDDSKTYILSCAAEEPIGSGIFSSIPTLLIRHKEGELEVYIVFDTYLGSDSIAVTHRMGSGRAQRDEWNLSTDGKAIFFPMDHSIFVKRLLQNNKLVVRVTPYGDSPVTSTFDLSGLPEAIRPLRSLIL